MSRTMPFVGSLSVLFALALVVAPVRADDPPSRESPAPAKAVDLENTACPVKGKPVVPGITETVNGAVVHFCCKACAAKYRATPEAYQSALRADPAVAQKMDDLAAGRPPVVVPAVSMETPASDKGVAFHDAMRKLWEDHV